MINRIESIMLVDDDEATNFLNKILIKDSSVTVDEIRVAYNGLEAINHIKDCHAHGEPLPSLVLLDINMPVMNGWEFLDEFIALPYSDKITLIAMVSNSYDDADIKKAKAFKQVGSFLRKPLSKTKMHKIIQDYVDSL